MADVPLSLSPIERDAFLERVESGEPAWSIMAGTGLTVAQIRLWERTDLEFKVRYRRATMQLGRGDLRHAPMRARKGDPSEDALSRFLQLVAEVGLPSVACAAVEQETGERFPEAYIRRITDPSNARAYRKDVADAMTGSLEMVTSRVRDGLLVNALTPTDKNPGGNPTAQKIWLEANDPKFARGYKVSLDHAGSVVPEQLGAATEAQAERIAAAVGGGSVVRLSSRAEGGGDGGT